MGILGRGCNAGHTCYPFRTLWSQVKSDEIITNLCIPGLFLHSKYSQPNKPPDRGFCGFLIPTLWFHVTLFGKSAILIYFLIVLVMEIRPRHIQNVWRGIIVHYMLHTIQTLLVKGLELTHASPGQCQCSLRSGHNNHPDLRLPRSWTTVYHDEWQGEQLFFCKEKREKSMPSTTLSTWIKQSDISANIVAFFAVKINIPHLKTQNPTAELGCNQVDDVRP